MERYRNHQDFLQRKLKAAKALVQRVHILPDPTGYHSDHFRGPLVDLEAKDEVLPPPDYYDSRGYPQWTFADQLELPGSIQPELWGKDGDMTVIAHPNRWDSEGRYYEDGA